MSRTLKVLCNLLAVVLVLGAVAIGSSYYLAMHTIQSRVADQLGTYAESVHVSSSQRILLSVLTEDTLKDLHIAVDEADLTLQGKKVPLSQIQADLTGLSQVRASDQTTVSTLELSGVVSWGDIYQLSNLSMSAESDETVKVTTKESILGVETQVIVVARPTITDEGTVKLADAHVSVAGVDLPDEVTEMALSAAQGFTLPSLPAGLRYSGLEISGDTGMKISVSGENVQLSQLF